MKIVNVPPFPTKLDFPTYPMYLPTVTDSSESVTRLSLNIVVPRNFERSQGYFGIVLRVISLLILDHTLHFTAQCQRAIVCAALTGDFARDSDGQLCATNSWRTANKHLSYESVD